MEERKFQVCTNCVMDTSDPEIRFDENGRCDFCDNYYNSIVPNWIKDESGAKKLDEIIAKIKKQGKGEKYDCMIGLSGGVDSSYLTYLAKEKFDLRPLIITVDTGWNLKIASENVERLVKKLKLDLFSIVVNWEEMKDLQVAFLRSQVPYQDITQDHAIFASLYNYAAKNKLKYILTGGNYSTECVVPPYEWTYLNDIRMIKDIHRIYGKIPLKTFPFCGMFKYRIFYKYFLGIRINHPLNLIPYDKRKVITELEKKFGWQEYKNKHYENIFTRFYEGYWLPKKYGYDKRKCDFSSLILTGQMSRQQAIDELAKPPYDELTANEDLEYIALKLGINKEEIIELMKGEKKTFRDYKNIEKLLKFAIKIAKLVGMENRNLR